jgi:hypothetical protein
MNIGSVLLHEYGKAGYGKLTLSAHLFGENTHMAIAIKNNRHDVEAKGLAFALTKEQARELAALLQEWGES